MRSHKFRLLISAVLLAPLGTVLFSQAAQATGSTQYVSATGSVGAGTSCASPDFVGSTHVAIQAAINAASSGDTVFICAGTYSISTRLDIAKSLTFKGDGARTTILDGLNTTQILIIQDNNLTANSGSEITVNVESLGFINGSATQIGGLGECVDGNRCGGAIFIERESRVNISDSYFKNNFADFVGGAVGRFIGDYQDVPATINNSTFESNTAVFDGGGVATLFGFGLTINSSTFYGNQITSRSAAAVIANFATATINSSTFLDNTGPAGTSVLYGGLTVNNSILAQSDADMIPVCNNQQTVSGSRGNLVTDNSCPGVTSAYPATPATDSAIVSFANLKMGPLTYRGYANKTIPLFAGSAALDFWSGCTGTDQIGASRPQGTSCDVGAYERPATQSLNTPTGWSYGTSTIERSNSSTLVVSSPAIDPAGQGVTYRSSTPSVCTIASNGTITSVTTGTCTVHADAPGWLLRDESTTSKTLTVLNTPTTTATPTTTTSTSSTTSTTTTTTPRSSSASASTVVANTGNDSSVATSSTTTISVGQSQIARITTATTVVNSPMPASTLPTANTAPTGASAPDAPSVTPGEAGAVVNGQSVDLQVARENNSLVISGAGIQATIFGISATGERIGLDADGNLRLNSEDLISLEATGFEPGEEVEAWMFSTPLQLGSITVNDAGKILGTFTLPKDVDSGSHRFVLKTANADGQDFVIGVGIAVGAIEKGSVVTRLLIAIPIALAIVAGLVIPTTVRRKRRSTSII